MSLQAIMPTYNQEKWLAAAIHSVAPQVDVLVVVDDGSTPETLDIIQRCAITLPNLRWIRHPDNRGTAEAINTGARLLLWNQAGLYVPIPDWLTWVSSDNVHYPEWASTLLSHTAPDVGVVYSAYDWVSPRRSRKNFKPYQPHSLVSNLNCYFGPSFIIRRGVWRFHRGRISHDYDNWLRVEEACWEQNLRIVGVDAPLCRYNAHDERVTITRRNEFDAAHWQAEARKRRSR